MNILSVIMATHNGGNELNQAIESICIQSYSEFEFIIVNDGSTLLQTDKILEQWRKSDPRIRVIRNRTKRGLAYSLNTGIRSSTGGIIARMDDDDIAIGERFAIQMEHMERHRDLDVLGTAVELFNRTHGDLGVHYRRECHADIIANLYYEVPFVHPTVMMRRSFLDRLGCYDEKLNRSSQDHDLWLRGANSSVYHNLQKPLLRYHLRQGAGRGRGLTSLQVLLTNLYRNRAPLRCWAALPRKVAALLRNSMSSKFVGFRATGKNF